MEKVASGYRSRGFPYLEDAGFVDIPSGGGVFPVVGERGLGGVEDDADDGETCFHEEDPVAAFAAGFMGSHGRRGCRPGV